MGRYPVVLPLPALCRSRAWRVAVSRDTLGDKDFPTRFQFSQHLGPGVEFARRGYAGLQYSHYSNADIEKPNDGIDLHQIVLGAHF